MKKIISNCFIFTEHADVVILLSHHYLQYSLAAVYFVDYGNRAVISREHLRMCTPEEARIPFLAIRYTVLYTLGDSDSEV